MSNLTRQQLEHIYEMVDSIPFSRPKRNIHRDFSDGCMMAELLHFFFPRLVELHNYPTTNAVAGKVANWETLNNKAFKRLGIQLKKKDIEMLVNCQPNVIEGLLKQIFDRVSGAQSNIDTSIKRTKTQEAVQDVPTKQTNIVDVELQQQIQEWSDKIEQAYMQLLRLQEISKLKDGVIRNLEKKFDALL